MLAKPLPLRVHFSPVKLTLLVSCMPFARRESKLEDEVEVKNGETLEFEKVVKV
jgi:hypothetical protein